MSKASRQRWKEEQMRRKVESSLRVVEPKVEEETKPLTDEEAQGLILRRFRLEDIDLDLIDDHELQPDLRVDEGKTKDLRTFIGKTRCIVPLIVATKEKGIRFERLDGHRRDFVARGYGITKVQCLIIDGLTRQERQALFMYFNCATRPLQGNERVQSVAKSDERDFDAVTDALTPKQRRQVVRAIEILGEDKFRELALDNKKLATIGERCADIERWSLAYTFDYVPTLRHAALFIVMNDANRDVEQLQRDISAKKIRNNQVRPRIEAIFEKMRTWRAPR